MNLTSPSRPMHREAPACFEGWHDSSFELRRGLVVTEHGALDALDEPLHATWQAASLTPRVRPCDGAAR